MPYGLAPTATVETTVGVPVPLVLSTDTVLPVMAT